MTFSIVAIDRDRKEVGFAIASCFWDAGRVGFAKAGAGAIVSQAQGNWDFIPAFYQKLDQKLDLKEILEHFRSIDDNIENRQVGMVAFRGGSLAFTGTSVFSAFQRTGTDYSCQGNILVSREVIDSMGEAFERSQGSLADRLYAALKAGDDAGGDMRGKISARLYVERDGTSPLSNVTTDFNVEEHAEPVGEIGRLLALRKDIINGWMLSGSASKAEGEEREKAVSELEEFLEGREDRLFLDLFSELADYQMQLGRREDAIKTLKTVVRVSPNMASTLSHDIRAEVLSR